MKWFSILTLCLIACLSTGCASTLRRSSTFDQSIKQVKTIVVMPPDVDVYRLTAGGVRELIDEWSLKAKDSLKKILEMHLEKQYGFQIKFADEDWLKRNHKALWYQNRSLYNAVSLSALDHAYSTNNTFPTKIKNFDYTLGPEVHELTQVVDADALLFIFGFDHEATVGRQALWWWNVSMSAVLGTPIFTTNPSLLVMGLVDGTSGDLIWFKTTPSESEYSFRDPKHMESIVQWLTKDFLK